MRDANATDLRQLEPQSRYPTLAAILHDANATSLQQSRTEAALVFGLMVPIAWAIPALVVLCCRCRRRGPSSASRPS